MTTRLVNQPDYPETPKGKRTVRGNIYGNVVGYAAGRRFWEFGAGASAKTDADLWAKGYSLAEVHNGTAYEKEGLI